MNHQEKIEENRRKGRDERLPLNEKAYAGFCDRRQHIFDALTALKNGHPGVQVDRVMNAIDELISITQVFAASAEHDEEFKQFLASKNFIVMKTLPDESEDLIG